MYTISMKGYMKKPMVLYNVSFLDIVDGKARYLRGCYPEMHYRFMGILYPALVKTVGSDAEAIATSTMGKKGTIRVEVIVGSLTSLNLMHMMNRMFDVGVS